VLIISGEIGEENGTLEVILGGKLHNKAFVYV
jgi:hypothetical protein